jgi:hypothetical protein
LRDEPFQGRAAFPGASARAASRPALFAKIDQASDNLHQLAIGRIV